MIAWLGIGVVIALAALGAPIFAVVVVATALGFYLAGIDLTVIVIEIYRIADTPLLVSLPLFTFAGYLLSETQTSQRLMNVTTSLFGWMPAGLAIVGFVACAIFTALTGASGVTIVALGALLLPMLRKAGYSQSYSLGLVTSSGSLGLLIVPSIPLILYGIIAQQVQVGEPFTIPQLFIAGLVPCLLMLIALSAWTIWKHGNVERIAFSWKNVGRSLLAAKWEIPLPFIVLLSIYTGVLAISEAAALTALYVLVVEVFVLKELKLTELPRVIRETMMMVGSILLILGCALALTNYFVDAQVPQKIFNTINATVDNPLVFLILLNLFLLLLGALLDIFSVVVIMVPLILPVAVAFGIHPLHLGVIMMANLQIGYFTPPIGMNLFIASYRFDRPIVELYRACLPFMVVLMGVLMLITYVPFLSLWFLELG
ncbi:MAG: TRAP transporter large permease subunit [Gammaproteobacteria bacterium]|nr:TRAP transporter large permease subunit [Gammaproteobacteria bacterium]